jgi:hypothetical protein
MVHKFGEELELQLEFWFWLGISLGYGLEFLLGIWLFLLGALVLEKGALPWLAIGFLLSFKVKVLGGGLCAYGWVTILLYCLWKNDHIPLFLTGYGPTLSSSSLKLEDILGSYLLSSLWHQLQLQLVFSDYVATTNPNPCVRALLVRHLT